MKLIMKKLIIAAALIAAIFATALIAGNLAYRYAIHHFELFDGEDAKVYWAILD